MNLTTVAKYGALAGLGLLAFTAGEGSWQHFTPAWRGGLDLSLMGTALIAIMWTYDGWADLSFMGGEVKDPGAHPAAGADPRDRGDRGGLSAAQRRLHLPGAAARDGRRRR